MPYIGHNPTNAGSFVQIDSLDASFNGSTTAFTLNVGGVAITPTIENLLVILDGVVQQPTGAFTLSGSTLTFTEAPASGTDGYIVLMGQSASIGGGAITADELAVSGDGTAGQLLKSDGDGTFTWLNQNAITGITSVGTIGTGVWDASVIASAKLDADTAHLSEAQTFSGAKTFSALSTHNSDIYIKGGGTLRLYQTGDANWGNLLFDSSVGFNFGDAVRVGGSLIAGTSSAFASSSHYFVGGVDGSKSAMRITSSTYGQPILDVHGTSTQTNDAFGLRVRAGNGSAWISDFQSSDGTSRFKVLANGDATFSGQIINTGNCSFRNGEILMANDRFDVLGGQDRRITLGTIGTPGQNSSHNVRGRSDGLFLNAPSKIVGEIDGSAKWEMTSSSTSFNNQLNINDDAFTFGDAKAKVYNFTFHGDSGFTSATEYMRIENSTGNWVFCVVEVTVLSGFGSSGHYGKQKREYYVRILGDDNNGNGVNLTTTTIGTDSGANEGVITLTTVGNEVTDTLLFKVQTAGSRRTSVFTKVYASNNQYLTITGQ